jgi:hypothetical protein
MEMERRRRNREVACTIGDLVAALFEEVEVLPMSETAKHAMVMIMISDIMKREGCTINFCLPARGGVEVAA